MKKHTVICAAGVLFLSGCAKRSPLVPAPVQSEKDFSFSKLTISPTTPHSLDLTRFTVNVTDGENRPRKNSDVSVILYMPSMTDMPYNEVVCKQSKPGQYVGSGRFTMPGDWIADVEVTASAVYSQRFPVTVK